MLERLGRLIDHFTGVDRSTEMVLGIRFPSIVRVCLVTRKTSKGPNALGNSLLYLSALLSVDEVISSGRAT